MFSEKSCVWISSVSDIMHCIYLHESLVYLCYKTIHRYYSISICNGPRYNHQKGGRRIRQELKKKCFYSVGCLRPISTNMMLFASRRDASHNTNSISRVRSTLLLLLRQRCFAHSLLNLELILLSCHVS